MAEIRVRDAAPQLIKQLDEISQELHEATTAGTIEKMIPRYWDMEKRIAEQNKEIGQTYKELRAEQHRTALVHQDLANLIIDTRNFSRAVLSHLAGLEKRFKAFGTKKRQATRPASSRKAKIVPGKKNKSPKK